MNDDCHQGTRERGEEVHSVLTDESLIFEYSTQNRIDLTTQPTNYCHNYEEGYQWNR